MPATVRTRARISPATEFKSFQEYTPYERPPLDLPDIVDDLGDRCVVVEARGKSTSRQWFIVVDSPGGHFDDRMKIVPGIERETENENDINELDGPDNMLGDGVEEDQEMDFQTQFDQGTNEFKSSKTADNEPFEPDFDGKISPQEHSSSEDVDVNSASANFPEVKEKFEPDWSESGTGFSQSTGYKADLSQSTPGNRDVDPFQESASSQLEASRASEGDGELLEGFGQRPQKRGVGFRKMVRKNRLMRVFQKQTKVRATDANIIADEDVPFDGHGSRADVGTRGYGR
uniref:Uncharacterized protein n=1 Tax=Grammatophora oceanica TaxID=210454 RepID=A0A7S1Y9Q0_9STRA|mmetsp:Transcript_34804/g.51727  ORF Transcript_34804/g.51727 Transcript_34804/m.51727 type:complete len:288 (+) Transcript_34804:207-1070(+)|eukprot:CAMPEP_0194049212 /NCGR_PEP_ID=MMETSP0009_2-20130614/30031_1 /TAXON_ID=210454 /ORGANISM="Grammatophora oceanica, Strain CCMP 410" /LENGTH=287 /DNA_ID=CAMNT_0038695311 /DNA_START=180 /DNA_END=1043 /DNA_ORIENTATION=+